MPVVVAVASMRAELPDLLVHALSHSHRRRLLHLALPPLCRLRRLSSLPVLRERFVWMENIRRDEWIRMKVDAVIFTNVCIYIYRNVKYTQVFTKSAHSNHHQNK